MEDLELDLYPRSFSDYPVAAADPKMNRTVQYCKIKPWNLHRTSIRVVSSISSCPLRRFNVSCNS